MLFHVKHTLPTLTINWTFLLHLMTVGTYGIRHWCQDKRPSSCRRHSRSHLNASCCILIKFVGNGQISKKLALFQIMAWRQTGDRTLSEATMAYLTYACMRHLASWSSTYKPEHELHDVFVICFLLTTKLTRLHCMNLLIIRLGL